MSPISLSEEEKIVFQCVQDGDLDGIRKQIDKHNFNVDILDDHGMTLLKHAAYKGNLELCQFFLDKGADVNCDKHEHGYTPLHFAVLSGNSDVCKLLLEAGAKSHHVNSVGRTPSQMAAFVGNHHCASVINNFVPKSDLEYYTIPSGIETSPKLPSKCLTPLHTLIMQVNMHPIRIALNLCEPLLHSLSNVKKVLDLMSTKEMSRGAQNNEIMAFKFHYIAYVLGEMIKLSKGPEPSTDLAEQFIKKVLRGARGEEYLETVMRDAVREFPYKESTLFRQMAMELVEMNGKVGSALSVVSCAVNGERFSSNEDIRCATCHETKPAKRCSRCKEIRYCDKQCQRLHWPVHKKECSREPLEELTSNIDSLKT